MAYESIELIARQSSAPRFAIGQLAELDAVVRNCAECARLFTAVDISEIMRDHPREFNEYAFCVVCRKDHLKCVVRAQNLDMEYSTWIRDAVERVTGGAPGVMIALKIVAN